MKKQLGAKTWIIPTPAWCVGTYDDQGRPNVMTIAWGGICCSQPPCVNISLRKATYSYAHILSRRAFTLSVPTVDYAAAADYFGMVSGRDTDKFKKTGLTPVKGDRVDAPYVAEFPLNLECRLIHHHEIGLHTLFVGEILEIQADEAVLDSQDRPAADRIKPLIYAPFSGGYFDLGRLVAPAFEAGKKYKSD